MKTLHLLRYAKSSWASPGIDDHERDLNDRGRRDAPRMGQALAAMIDPQVIHCSSALRARRTLAGLCEGWPELSKRQHITEAALYTFDWRDLLAWLRRHDHGERDCFLIGHNPALTDLCNQLCGRRALDNLPTAGYLQLSLPAEAWDEIAEGTASLEAWQFPRDLP
jgi:phosphohistidine phosphatase